MQDLLRQERPFVHFLGHSRRDRTPALVRDVKVARIRVAGVTRRLGLRWDSDALIEEEKRGGDAGRE
jgi:hypothetical protein